jgi:hypothetical protein
LTYNPYELLWGISRPRGITAQGELQLRFDALWRHGSIAIVFHQTSIASAYALGDHGVHGMMAARSNVDLLW